MSRPVLVGRAPWPALAATALLTGCGDDGNRAGATAPRGPLPEVVGVVVDREAVRFSPPEVGAGPVRLLVSNQSGGAATVSLSGGGSPAQTLRLGPRGIRTVRSVLVPGVLLAHAQTRDGTRRGRLHLGAARASADSEPMVP